MYFRKKHFWGFAMKTGKAILLGLIATLVIGPSILYADTDTPSPTSEMGIIRFYKAIESGVVSGYKAIENSVVSGYMSIENGFVKTFLTPRGWSEDSTPTLNRPTENSTISNYNSMENSLSITAELSEKYSPIQRTDS